MTVSRNLPFNNYKINFHDNSDVSSNLERKTVDSDEITLNNIN